MRTARTLTSAPVVTQALIAINVVFFLAETLAGAPFSSGGGGTIWNHGVLYGPALTAHNFPAPFPYSGTHEYWRILTSGFLHDGFLHILINMVSLYFVGMVLEPAIGHVNFGAVYFASLLAGSFGALLFQPGVPTVGASGAIFGIFGALIVVAYHRGIPIWRSGLGFVLLFNLLFSFTYSGISVGGHLGGLVAGLLCGEMIYQWGERRRMPRLALAGCALVGIAGVIGAIAVAGSHGLTPHGLTL